MSSTAEASDEIAAATKIQAQYRGLQTRKVMSREKPNMKKGKASGRPRSGKYGSSSSVDAGEKNDTISTETDVYESKEDVSVKSGLEKERSRASRSIVGKRNKSRANAIASNHRSSSSTMRSSGSAADGETVSGAATIVTSIGTLLSYIDHFNPETFCLLPFAPRVS